MSFTVHAQLFLASGLCVYKYVCIVIALVLSIYDCSLCCAASQLLCVGLRYSVTLDSAVSAFLRSST